MNWIKFENEDCWAIVICNYKSLISNHINLQIGDFVYIKEQYPGWYRGFTFTNPCVIKAFPITHVKILSNEIHPDLWAEICSWIPKIRENYIVMDDKQFNQMCEAVQLTMVEKRFDCLLDRSRITEINRKSLVTGMEIARKKLGLPIIILDDKLEKVSLNEVSYLDLYSQHNKLIDNSRNTSGQFDSTLETVSIYIKMLNIDFGTSKVDPNIDVIITLYKLEDRVRISRFSESYTYHVVLLNNPCNLVKTNAIVTKDIQLVPNHKIFVVFQIIRIDRKFRRHLGTGVLDITKAISETQDFNNQVVIHIPKEENFESFTDKLIHEYNVKSNKFDRVGNISIQFKGMRPDDLSDRHIVISGLNPYYPPPIRSRRNCLYLTLSKGELDKGIKNTNPNFEIDISIRDDMGNLVCMPNDDWRGISTYTSAISYHVAKPKWDELICIPLFDKLDDFPDQTHIRFTIWHRSLKKGDKIYGVAFLKFFPKTNSYAIVRNKDHDNYHVLSFHKMDIDQIKTCKYLQISEETIGSLESLATSHETVSNSFINRVRTIGRRKPRTSSKDTLSVQTLLISNEYTFDELLANVCSNKPIDDNIMNDLHNQEIIARNIDVDELKKFAIKILTSSLKLLESAAESSLLGRNMMILLGEMFKAIKNLPDYQTEISKFILESMNYKVHAQILHEMINHVPEFDSNTLRASDWFMKIAVKSYQNCLTKSMITELDTTIFNDMMDRYLLKLEDVNKEKENKILRSIVLSKAGPIINSLIPVCHPIGMARLVHNLLESSRDLDAISKAGLTMDCMNSSLFLDPECRRIILPETTRNILDLFYTQLNRVITDIEIFYGREIDQDHMLDNICEKMIEFMQLHERSWQRTPTNVRDDLVYELLFEHNMLRSCIAIVSMGLEYLRHGDACCKLLYKPLRVLVTVIITALKFMSDELWQRVVAAPNRICDYCDLKQMTDNYDMITEIMCLIDKLQKDPIFPHSINANDERRPLAFYHKGIGSPLKEPVQRQHKEMKQPWFDMLFVQNRQFLVSIEQIHRIIIKPFYLKNIIHIKRRKQSILCCCHPSEKLQGYLINFCVENIELIVSQFSLKVEDLPSSSALRIMAHSSQWDFDLRLYGASLIKEIWHDLDIRKLFFSPFFFYVFSKLTTIQNYNIRLLAVECMFDIVHLDQDKKKTEMITHIDTAMETADGNYCEEMTKALRKVFSNNCQQFSDDNQLVEHIIVQMNNIQECSQHLTDESPINGMIVINNLRKFYQKMGRSDIIGRYLFKLIELHLTIKNFTEIGYTLLELSSFYRWSHEPLENTYFPLDFGNCDFHWQLKAQLLEESLKFFELEDWEQGIEVCKELVNGYTHFLIDFVKLSAVHRKMSEFFHRIMFDSRPESSVYIVFYYGNGFPKFITELPHKSIVLVTKRNPAEMAIDLNSQFKNTTVEKKFPSDSDKEGTEKRIFFAQIKPCNSVLPKKYKGKMIKQRILRYYENYQIDEFVFKRLINPTQEDPKKRKIEGCIVKCDGKLPNILSVVPVISLKMETIDPFNEALYDLQNQIKKDTILYQDYEMCPPEKRETMYQKMKEVMLKYISPVSGGLSKLVEMIPLDDENKISYAGDVFSDVFSLICLYLQRFEIYNDADSYGLFISEFRKILDDVNSRLDIFEDDFNINSLLDQFTRSRKNILSVSSPRKPSVIFRQKHDDDVPLVNTLGRKTKINKEILGDSATLGRNSGIGQEEPFQAVVTRPRIDIGEPELPPKRKSTSDIPTAKVPPIPPKPKSNQRVASSFSTVTNFERPGSSRAAAPKPSISFLEEISSNNLHVPQNISVSQAGSSSSIASSLSVTWHDESYSGQKSENHSLSDCNKIDEKPTTTEPVDLVFDKPATVSIPLQYSVPVEDLVPSFQEEITQNHSPTATNSICLSSQTIEQPPDSIDAITNVSVHCNDGAS